MPWIDGEWWDSIGGTLEVESDRVGVPKPTGVYGPNGKELHRIQPVGFNRKPQLVYVRKRGSEEGYG